MTAADPFAVARQPTQRRARERFERILGAAEPLLLEVGIAGFSIPLLAERLGYTRGSVYAYFPTPEAILNELGARALAQLEAGFVARAAELRAMDWRAAAQAVVHQAVEFHNARPVARLVILGGATTHEGYRAQELTIKRLGDLARAVWSDRGLALPAGPPDVTTLAADIATACFRRSFFEHGEITPAYRDAAVRAMTAFLATWLDAPAAPRRAGRR